MSTIKPITSEISKKVAPDPAAIIDPVPLPLAPDQLGRLFPPEPISAAPAVRRGPEPCDLIGPR